MKNPILLIGKWPTYDLQWPYILCLSPVDSLSVVILTEISIPLSVTSTIWVSEGMHIM